MDRAWLDAAARETGAGALDDEAARRLIEWLNARERDILSAALLDCADRGGERVSQEDLRAARRMYAPLWRAAQNWPDK